MQKTDFDWDLVIADDFSTDGTREIIMDYKSRYPDKIKLIFQKQNVGARQNWFDLLFSPDSKYIAYLEGDDYWIDKLKLQKQVDLLEKNQSIGMVHTGAHISYLESGKEYKWIKNKHNYNEVEDVYTSLLLSDYDIRSLTVVFRRKLMVDAIKRNMEFYDEKYLLGDHQSWLLISRISKIEFIDEATSVRNLLEDSATQSNDISKLINLMNSLYELKIDFLNKFDQSSNIRNKIEFNHYESILGIAFNSINKDVANDYYKKISYFKDFKTIKHKLLYWGSSNRFTNFIVRYFIDLRYKATLFISKYYA